MEENKGKQIDLSDLKELQMQVMDVIDKFCRENNIRYFITAGTLIGALRHKGYIPWDDDIDIVMLRNDYEKFIAKFQNYSERYKVYSIETDINCHYAYAKVYDNNTVFIEGHEGKRHEHIGINVDIFPLDYVTHNYDDAVRLKNKIKPYNTIMMVKTIVWMDRGWGKNISLFFLKAFCSLFSFSWCVRHIDRIARTYESNTDSRYVANAVIYAKGEREVLEREWFDSQIELPFEDRKYLAPVGADQYMRRLFGDYMQLPPKDKQVTHHSFKAYYK